ncbi:MAG TPA: GNAT family N-acetyltransferase [Anaerolineae bacterium]|nr:GNAT family N-acetyltransferase [Anaerolineae bacterium]
MTVRLRTLTLNDAEPWAELLAIAFDRTPQDMHQLLHWLQAEHELIAWGAWEDTRLIAQYSSLLTAIWLPPTASFECVGLSINLAVHPAYRGRGLVKQVAQPVYATLADRGVLAGVGFSNAAGVKVDRRSRAYGYRVVGQMQSTLVALARRSAAEALHLTTTWPAAPFDFIPSRFDRISFAASPLLAQQRFAQHPFRCYQFGIWEGADRVRGIVIYRLATWWGVRVASLLAAYGDDLPALLKRWTAALSLSGIRFAHALTTPASRLRTALRGMGWSIQVPYSRAPYFLTVKPLRESAAPLLDFQHWDCSGGDIL